MDSYQKNGFESSPFQHGEKTASLDLSPTTKPAANDNHIKPLRLAKRPEPVEEFKFRPIRLGSRNRLVSEDEKAADARRTSDHSLGRPQDEKHKLFNPLMNTTITSPTSSKRNSLSSVSTSPRANRRSIQIKNLPIVQAQEKAVDTSGIDDMIFAICLVDFHHVRGPEVQWWKSNYHPEFSEDNRLFKNLSFQALPDGSHLFEETFSNFNLVYDFENGISLDQLGDYEAYDKNPTGLKTLFGCLCVRQVKTSDLSDEERARHTDFTRSIVQKAVVVISRKQPIFTKIKEKLSIITKSYFQQDDFNNVEILESLFDNLNSSFKLVETDDASYKLEFMDPEATILHENKKNEKEEEFFVNLNLKQTIMKFKANFLIIFKALLLEKKILVFSNNNLELLTQFQNNLISMIPNLINHLDYSGCPLSDYTEVNSPLSKPNSLNTNNRQLMLRFFGLPLQVFNTKGAFWNPYLPLQQLDELRIDSFMAGCSNLLFVNQLEHYKIDLLVNLDTNELTFPVGKADDLILSLHDKKFINNLIHSMKSNSEEFIGNDDYIRYQFEDYLSSLVSTTRFHQYVERFKQPPPGFDPSANPALGNLGLFNGSFIQSWANTKMFRVWDAVSDEFIFNFHEPKHLAVDMVDNQPYKLASLFKGFNFKLTSGGVPSTESSDGVQPQKFIPSPDSEAQNGSNTEEDGKKPLAWLWGFKKK